MTLSTSFSVLLVIVLITLFGYLAFIKETQNTSSFIHIFPSTILTENNPVLPEKSGNNTPSCKKLVLYDNELRKLAHQGYKFLVTAKCFHEKFKTREDWRPMVPKDCKGPSIHTQSNGRLGNQICEYLTLKYFERYFKVPISVREGVAEMVKSHLTPGGEMTYNLTCTGGHGGVSVYGLLKKLLNNYTVPNLHPFDEINRNIAIGGYPCPMDILMDTRSYIAAAVNFNKKTSEEAEARLISALASKNIARETNLLISIHVRRKDYALRIGRKFNRTYLTPCYYKQAMHHYQLMFEDPVFVVASDDIEWCKEHLDEPRVVFLEHEKGFPPILDMAATSLCDHHIVGYGTFGFLGAYFGRTGYIIHSFVENQKQIVENEYKLLCSESDRLIAIPDMGYN